MTRDENIFSGTPGTDGLRSVALVGVMGVAVGAGAISGHLTELSCLVVSGYWLGRGLLPNLTHLSKLRKEKRLCAMERDVLIEISMDDEQDVLATDMSKSGAVMKMACMTCLAKGWSSKRDAVRTVLSDFQVVWDARVTALYATAEDLPVLGLAGSLVGMVTTLSELGESGDNAVVMAGLATAMLTTLLGGVLSLVVNAFARDLEASVAQHLSDLEFISAMLIGEDEPPKSATTGYAEPEDLEYSSAFPGAEGEL